jgi:dTMP kinase
MLRIHSGTRHRGCFITFEGTEGSGKSLQMKLLTAHFSAQGIPFVVTREPGGTDFGNRLREILLESKGPSRAPVAELLLYLADRYQDLIEVIEPALEAGKHVLCDRYHDATRAYQGFARGVNPQLIDTLSQELKIRVPDLTFLLDLPTEIGLQRARGRNLQEKTRLGRFEEESLQFHRRVRQAYRLFARREPQRFRMINAIGEPEAIHSRILKALNLFLVDFKSRPETSRKQKAVLTAFNTES